MSAPIVDRATTIEHATARLLRVPLTRAWGADVREVSVVVVEIRDSEGSVGHGFTWTPTIGARAVLAMLDDHVLPFAVGRPAATEGWNQAWEHVHEAGGGGVTTIALAGLDLARWDLACRKRGVSLVDHLGRKHDRQPAYGSGVNLHYSLDELVEQAQRWVARGFDAIKIKVGGPDLAVDVDRVAAVREVIGPKRHLLVDANQRWELDQAITAVTTLAQFNLGWIEEPLRADDLTGYIELMRHVEVPVALGENVHTVHRFRDFIEAGAVDVVQPNIVRVGGITPFLEIVDLARKAGLELAPHLLPELSAQLAFALPETTWVEDVEDAGFWELGALTTPTGVRIAQGWASGGPTVGLGFSFKEELT